MKSQRNHTEIAPKSQRNSKRNRNGLAPIVVGGVALLRCHRRYAFLLRCNTFMLSQRDVFLFLFCIVACVVFVVTSSVSPQRVFVRRNACLLVVTRFTRRCFCRQDLGFGGKQQCDSDHMPQANLWSARNLYHNWKMQTTP